MKITDLSDSQYFKILDQIDDIRFLIVKAGQMATKTKVENAIMARYGFNRGDAHSLANYAESQNKRPFSIGAKAAWNERAAKRPEPKPEDWPEL